jgi:biopolymer transport protein ExbB
MAWWDNNWSYKRKITIDNSGIWPSMTGLFDFPVLVKLNGNYSFDFGKAQGDGRDIRFIESGESTVLDHETAYYASGQTGVFWVRVPTIPISGQQAYFWMYYGNFTAPSGDNRTGVWKNGYEAVYHFNQTGGNYSDSTRYGHEAIEVGPGVTRTGQRLGLGYTPYWDGTTGAAVVVSNSVGWQLTGFDFNNFTLEAIIIPSGSGISIGTGSGGIQMFPLIDKGQAEAETVVADVAFLMGIGQPYTGFRLSHDMELRRNPPGNDSLSENMPASGGVLFDGAGNTAYHVSIMVSGKAFTKGFVNGVENFHFALTGYPSTGGSHKLGIGCGTRASATFIQGNYRGWMDEVRISRVTRPQIWMNYSYRSNNDNLLIQGAEELNGPFTRELNISGISNVAGLPWVDVSWLQLTAPYPSVGIRPIIIYAKIRRQAIS